MERQVICVRWFVQTDASATCGRVAQLEIHNASLSAEHEASHGI